MKAFYSRSARDNRVLPLLLMFLAVSLLILALTPFADAKGVKTRSANESDIESGTYSLITYGCDGTSDPAAIAFLQKEGATYDINVVAPRSEHKVLAGLDKDQAVELAKDFATCNPSATGTDLERIAAPDGSLLGYEFSPRYLPLHAGNTDGADARYHVKDNDTIRARVDVDPLLEFSMMGGG